MGCSDRSKLYSPSLYLSKTIKAVSEIRKEMMVMMKFQKTVCDISFSEKVRIFSYDYLKCCIYISNFSSSRYLFTKMLFSKLIGASQVLEDFLDFHGAKNNTNLYFY